jgi:hypothetical protein
MKPTIPTTLAILLLSAAPAACSTSSDAAPPPVPDPVARGKELVALGGCGHCHTPMVMDPAAGMPVPDPSMRLAGHPMGTPDPEATPGAADQAVIGSTFTAFRAPFGVVYAANLTPHVETGLGAWTEAEFIATMRTGKHRGTGRVVLPPMPWQNLATQSDEDLRAIFAYLRSLPPVENMVPPPKVSKDAMAAIEKGYAVVGVEH